jgi:hypothetical protein
VNVGEAVSFKIGTDSAKYRIDIYRLGYYGGAGARLLATADGHNLHCERWRNDPLIVPADFAKLRFWRNGSRPAETRRQRGARLRHSRSRMERGSRQRLPAGGTDSHVEDDGQKRAVYPGLRHGVRGRHGHAFPHALPRAERRAHLVFSAGTVQWAWGLDPNHDTETGIPPERANGSNIRVGVDLKGPVRTIQQATR